MELHLISRDLTPKPGGLFAKYKLSSITQLPLQVKQPLITVSPITSGWYQEHQLSGWHNITSESDDLTETLDLQNQFLSCCWRPKGILVINSVMASGGGRFCLTSELTALQTKASSHLREQRQGAVLDTRLHLFSYPPQHPPDPSLQLVTLVMKLITRHWSLHHSPPSNTAKSWPS